jgi:hypothetical protein
MGSTNVPRQLTALALTFLTGLRYSNLSKQVGHVPVLYQDRWIKKPRPLSRIANPFSDEEGSVDQSDSSDAEQGEVCEGLNFKHSIRRYGFAWWASKVDWTSWLLKEEHAKHFLVDQPEFASRFQKRRTRVSQIDVVF